MPHLKNRILARASPVDLEDFRQHLRLVELEHGRVIAESRQRVNQVYFPHEGILSCVVEMENGVAIESGMIGNDGVFGAAQALDHKLSLHKVIVQVPGFATVVDADRLRDLTQSSPELPARSPRQPLKEYYEQYAPAIAASCQNCTGGKEAGHARNVVKPEFVSAGAIRHSITAHLRESGNDLGHLHPMSGVLKLLKLH